MGAKTIKLGSWDKRPAIATRIGMSCVAYTQWNECDGRMMYYKVSDTGILRKHHSYLFTRLKKYSITFIPLCII